MKSRTLCLSAAGAAVLMACSHHELDKSFEISDEVTDVRCDVDSGNIRILGTEADTTHVELNLDYRGGDEPEYSVVVEGGVLTVRVECNDACYDLDGDVTVRTSKKVGTVAKTGSGQVEILETEGATQVETGSGDVTLENTGGSGTIETRSGSVNISGMRGTSLDVETGSGGIESELVEIPSDITLDTGSGDVHLAVPSATYSIEITTGSGNQTIDGITVDQSADKHIAIETGSGDVSLLGF